MYIVAYVFSFCLPKEFHFLAIFSRRLKRQALDLDYIMLRTIFFILRPSMGGFFYFFTLKILLRSIFKTAGGGDFLPRDLTWLPWPLIFLFSFTKVLDYQRQALLKPSSTCFIFSLYVLTTSIAFFQLSVFALIPDREPREFEQRERG